MSHSLDVPNAGRFTFQSPSAAMRHAINQGNSDVTDTSATSTPTNHSAYSNSYAPSHPMSASSIGLASRSPTPEHVPSSSASAYAPIRRSKDKQKHSESENRRRQRLRAKFTALQMAAGVGGKKDRYSILGQAVEKLKEYEAHIAHIEQEKSSLAVQLAQSTMHPGLNGGSASVTTAASSTPALSTPLSRFQMLANVAVCYISLDGRILDANDAFITLFRFSSDQTGASPPAVHAAGISGGLDLHTANGLMSQTAAASLNQPPPSTGDIYASSIFALTHHQELIHTLSVLRNLLCGVVDVYECTKRCMDMRGRVIECSMTISSVHNAGKIVMFLCMFVPKSNADPTAAASTNHADSTQQVAVTPMPMHMASGSDMYAAYRSQPQQQQHPLMQPQPMYHSQPPPVQHQRHQQVQQQNAHAVSHHPFHIMPPQPQLHQQRSALSPFSPVRTYPRTPVATHAQHAYLNGTSSSSHHLAHSAHNSSSSSSLEHGVGAGASSSLAALSHIASRQAQPTSMSTPTEMSDAQTPSQQPLLSSPTPVASSPSGIGYHHRRSSTSGGGHSTSSRAVVAAGSPSESADLSAANAFLDLTTTPTPRLANAASGSSAANALSVVATPVGLDTASAAPDLGRPLSDSSIADLTRVGSTSSYRISPGPHGSHYQMDGSPTPQMTPGLAHQLYATATAGAD